MLMTLLSEMVVLFLPVVESGDNLVNYIHCKAKTSVRFSGGLI